MNPNHRLWDKNLQLMLVSIVGFNILPHILDVPPWITALSMLCLLWKTLYLTRGTKLPPRWLLWVFVLGGSGGVFLQYETLIGQEAASALLVFLASSKLLETNQYRDAMLVIFTSYFLLMAHLLNSQSLVSTLYMGVDVLLITALMFQAHKRDRRNSVRSFRPAMKMLAYSLPVWVFLFIAFPRFSAGLWQLNRPLSPAIGFSDNLNPGAISNLIENDEPAFRVSFEDDQMLSPEDLYWRGGILSQGHGLQWAKGLPHELKKERLSAKGAPASSRTVQYSVWLEPFFRKWIFVLDYPIDLEMNGYLKFHRVQKVHGFTYEAGQNISTRVVYNATSSSVSPMLEISDFEKQMYLKLPENPDPRFQTLVEELRNRSSMGTPAIGGRREHLLSKIILTWFDEQGFRYTREPGALSSDDGVLQLNQFLFERRRGFCEHYAATYATLMRALGVPARVTIGFQGGRVNHLGQYLLVRNLDAHAWNEIWVADPEHPTLGRWERADPTATIAPLRIQLGGDFNNLDTSLLARGLSHDELRRNIDGGLYSLPQRLMLIWDVAQMNWNSFLLSYDFSYQKSIAEKLGVKGASRSIFFIWLTVGVLVFVISLHFSLRRKARQEDPLLLGWRQFCQKLEKTGVTRVSSEGPLDYSVRASQLNPGQATEIMRIANLFIDLRYGPLSSNSHKGFQKKLKIFRQSVRRFSIDSNSRANSSWLSMH